MDTFKSHVSSTTLCASACIDKHQPDLGSVVKAVILDSSEMLQADTDAQDRLRMDEICGLAAVRMLQILARPI